MTEVLTFDSYNPAEHTLSVLYLIGATEDRPKGVAQEMAEVFDVELAPIRLGQVGDAALLGHHRLGRGKAAEGEVSAEAAPHGELVIGEVRLLLELVVERDAVLDPRLGLGKLREQLTELTGQRR